MDEYEKDINQIRAIGEKTPAKLSDSIIFNDFTINHTLPRVERPIQQAVPEEPEQLQQELHQQTVPIEAPNMPQERTIEPIAAIPRRTLRILTTCKTT